LLVIKGFAIIGRMGKEFVEGGRQPLLLCSLLAEKGSRLFMIITREQAEHIALLSRLELTEAEKEQYTAQLNSILEYAKILVKLDTSQVEPMVHVLPLSNVLREDQIGNSLDQELVLQNAPDRVEGFFKVPRIV
jgi:aspartyl-tRNA(Asn)/glutamyl-tRNA(Gln) amidotransferase subunit C